MNRKRAMALIGSGLLLPSCAKPKKIRVGSRVSSESQTLAELYAQRLELTPYPIERIFTFKDTQSIVEAMQRDAIDIYPEYTAMALNEVLHIPFIRDPKALLERLQAEYEKRFGFTWMIPSLASDTPTLAVTKAFSRTHGLRTLSACSKAAPALRLCVTSEFKSSLERLKNYYGGFAFKSVTTVPSGEQYRVLKEGAADICSTTTTDGHLLSDSLVQLADDRGFWPPNTVAPVVRSDVVLQKPLVKRTLFDYSLHITTYGLEALNLQIDIKKRNRTEVATEFLY